ncbi:MAG: S28 family serine protease [Bacteroidota bacterium]
MRFFIFTVLPILLFSLSGMAQASKSFSDLELDLFALQDVSFKTENGQDFTLYVRQPLDHQHPEKGYFYQKVYLNHKSYSAPTVIVTEGYTARRNRQQEITRILEANQVQVEHRYFGESMPDSIDYQYLNLEQVAGDLHHIRTVLGTLYTGPWLSTGRSKGGATTIFYRYFFPEDTEAGLPYVAPINLEFEEQRIYDFLDTIGSDECREKMLAVQRKVLSERATVLPLLKYYAKGKELEFSYLSLEQAFELMVLEYPFSFWQYGASCTEIPSADAPIQELLDYLMNVSGIDFFSDSGMDTYASHYYQSANEFGYYGYETDKFKDLIKAWPLQPNPHAAFTPNKMDVPFDDSLLKQVHKWLDKDADHMIYIYGAIDTWTASAVPENDKVDALWFFMEGKHHGNANIGNMDEAERKLLIGSLKNWMGLE